MPLRAVVSALYPPRCAGCDAPGIEPFCEPCAATLEPNAPACPRCAVPIAGPVAIVCRACQLTPPPQAATVAPWRYGGELGRALRATKLAGRPDLARALAPLVAPFLAALCRETAATLICPVPVHWRRLLARSFDHAELHASYAAPTGVPVRRALRRTRATPRQVGRGAPDRRANVDHAFAVRRRVTDATVVLFDDVMTTGATMAAAAQALRLAGAREVYAFAIARAE